MAEHVLIFGDDMRICLSLVRAFGRSGKKVHVVPIDRKAPALHSKYIFKIHNIVDAATSMEKWREQVSNLLSSKKFELVIPCVDPVQIAMDLNRDIFEGLNLAIPSRKNWDVFFDKKRTHEICEHLDIPVASCAELQGTDTADSLIDRFNLPLVVKPQRSNRADRLDVNEKVTIALTKEELADCLSELPDRSGYIAETYFTGEGVGVSVLSDHGEILQAFQHRRLREGWGGSSSYRISETIDPDMLAACQKIMHYTGHHGVCMFEFRRNRQTGQWILLETNSRFWGSLPLPVSMGVDFPNMLFDLMQGRPVKTVTYKSGYKSRNIILDGYNILKAKVRGQPFLPWMADLGGYLLQPFGWIFGKQVNDAFVSDDLLPGFAEFRKLPSGVMRKLRGN